MNSWDFIIVGAGTAGCVLARRIAESGDRPRVLLIEAGPNYPGALLNMPLPGMKLGRLFSWRQKSIPQPRLGNRQIEWPMGRVVGGTSSVNAMMAFQGHPANFDAWEAAGNPGWSSSSLTPYLRKVFGPTCHGEAGDPMDPTIRLSPARFRSPFSEAFLAACAEAGMIREDPLSGIRANHCGYFPVLQRNGERWESARAYLEPARKLTHLSVQPRTTARRILFERGRAVGLETTHGSGTESHRAIRGVILCAGVFETPRLLQASGIGPAEILESAGVRVLQNLPAVGANFHDHVRVGMHYHTSRTSPGSKRHWLPGFARYLLRRNGVMTSNCCESGAFLRSDPSKPAPDIQLITHFQTFGPKGEVDIEACLVAPKSRGWVCLNPANPTGPPLVNANFLAEEEDIDTMIRAVQHVRNIAAQSSLRRFPLLRATSPAAIATTDPQLRKAIFHSATTAYHPCGSCAMGPPGTSALGPDLRVHGLEGLWVADASAMPLAPSGNIACAILVLAEKAADLILDGIPPHTPAPPDS